MFTGLEECTSESPEVVGGSSADSSAPSLLRGDVVGQRRQRLK
jgi:hypothetical protein